MFDQQCYKVCGGPLFLQVLQSLTSLSWEPCFPSAFFSYSCTKEENNVMIWHKHEFSCSLIIELLRDVKMSECSHWSLPDRKYAHRSYDQVSYSQVWNHQPSFIIYCGLFLIWIAQRLDWSQLASHHRMFTKKRENFMDEIPDWYCLQGTQMSHRAFQKMQTRLRHHTAAVDGLVYWENILYQKNPAVILNIPCSFTDCSDGSFNTSFTFVKFNTFGISTLPWTQVPWGGRILLLLLYCVNNASPFQPEVQIWLHWVPLQPV